MGRMAAAGAGGDERQRMVLVRMVLVRMVLVRMVLVRMVRMGRTGASK